MSNEYSRHFEKSSVINAEPETVFAYADDHRNFSSHMNQSSMMMGGGSMKTETDTGGGREIGSHIRMSGKVLGVSLSLDEVVVEHEPPTRKVWETVGEVNLLVIDQYRLGFEIAPSEKQSNLRVFIDYDLPKSWKTRVLGGLFGGVYAKWCVNQMTEGVVEHFESK